MELARRKSDRKLLEVTRPPAENGIWIVKMPDGSNEAFYADQFRHMFTLVEDMPKPINTIEEALQMTREELKEKAAAKAAGAETKTDKPKTEPKAKVEKPAKEKKESKPRGRQKIAGDHPLRFVVENHTKEQGENFTVFETEKVQGFRSLKIDGNMYAAMTFNTKGMTLWVRTKAVDGIAIPDGIETKTFNHMFDLRVKFLDTEAGTADTAENIKCIHELLNASIKWQQEKKANTKKAQADKKRAEKAAEKAAKAAAEKEAREAKKEAPGETDGAE